MNVFISSMEDFASINAVYAIHFGVSPPARACVAVDLPHPLRMVLDCVAYAEQKACDRKALHVQGLSYWAPANIGPYSQAILVRTKLSPSIPRSQKKKAEPLTDAPIIPLSLSHPGRRTRLRLGPDRSRSQFPRHLDAAKSRDRDRSRITTLRSHREGTVGQCGRRRRMGHWSRAAHLVLGRPRIPHLARDGRGATLGRESG
jgi:hypothetical protein